MSTFLRDDATFAAIQSGDLPSTPCFSVHKNGTDQTGIADSTTTLVTWPTEIYDVGSFFAGNKWTPPAGKVHMSACVVSNGAIAGGNICATQIYKNGSLFKNSTNGAATNQAAVVIAIDDDANGTDYYEVYGFVDLTSGTGTFAGASYQCWFMGHVIR